jgi:hypothetical protein
MLNATNFGSSSASLSSTAVDASRKSRSINPGFLLLAYSILLIRIDNLIIMVWSQDFGPDLGITLTK